MLSLLHFFPLKFDKFHFHSLCCAWLVNGEWLLAVSSFISLLKLLQICLSNITCVWAWNLFTSAGGNRVSSGMATQPARWYELPKRKTRTRYQKTPQKSCNWKDRVILFEPKTILQALYSPYTHFNKLIWSQNSIIINLWLSLIFTRHDY